MKLTKPQRGVMSILSSNKKIGQKVDIALSVYSCDRTDRWKPALHANIKTLRNLEKLGFIIIVDLFRRGAVIKVLKKLDKKTLV